MQLFCSCTVPSVTPWISLPSDSDLNPNHVFPVTQHFGGQYPCHLHVSEGAHEVQELGGTIWRLTRIKGAAKAKLNQQMVIAAGWWHWKWGACLRHSPQWQCFYSSPSWTQRNILTCISSIWTVITWIPVEFQGIATVHGRNAPCNLNTENVRQR